MKFPVLTEKAILSLVAQKTAGQIRTQSPDWYQLKNKIITSTNVPAILEYSPYGTKKEMWQRKVQETSTLSEHPAVLWGIKYESMARTLCSQRLGHIIHETGLKIHPHSDWSFLGATPDGLGIDEKGQAFLVEFKCLATRQITHRIPLDYWVQVQVAMEVWGVERCLYSENIFKEYQSESEWLADDTVPKESKGYWAGMSVWWSLVEHWDIWVERRQDWWQKAAPQVRNFWQEIQKSRETTTGGELVSQSAMAVGSANSSGTAMVPKYPYHYQDIDWKACVRGNQLSAWLKRDPLTDWLNLYGRQGGFQPDQPSELTMSDYVFDQTDQFRNLIISQLKDQTVELQLKNIDISEHPELAGPELENLRKALIIHYNFHSVRAVNDTTAAILNGVPVIFNGLLFHASSGLFGRADLIVRQDLLKVLFPEALLGAAETLGDSFWETAPVWVAVNFKYAILDLGADGQRLLSSPKQNEYQLQLCVLSKALSEIQKCSIPWAYLISRKLRSKRFQKLSTDEGDGVVKVNGVEGSEVGGEGEAKAETGKKRTRKTTKGSAPITESEKAGEGETTPKTGRKRAPPPRSNGNTPRAHKAAKITTAGEETKEDNGTNAGPVETGPGPGPGVGAGSGANAGLYSSNCLQNLVRIPIDRLEWHKELHAGIQWLQRLRRDGGSWHPLQKPVPELRPNMKNHQDYPWRQAKTIIAEQSGECTQIMNLGYQCRQQIIEDFSLAHWQDLRHSHLKAAGVREADLVTKILAINNPNVLAEASEEEGGYGYGEMERPLDLSECRREDFEGGNPKIALFMDFETVTDLYDTFGQMPEIDGHEMVYLIGCLEYNWQKKTANYHHFIVEALNPSAEKTMFEQFVLYLQEVIGRAGWAPSSAHTANNNQPIRLYHWTAAELTHLGKIAARHGLSLPTETIETVDLYKLFRTNRIVIEGSFCFALKSVAKAWYRHGLIATTWKDGMNGAQASVGAWRAMEEAVLQGKSLPNASIVQQLIDYNYNDCKVLQEMLITLLERLRAKMPAKGAC